MCFPPSFCHLAKQLQRRYLEIDQSETRMACGGHVYWRIGTKWAIFIDDLSRMLPTASYQILIRLAKRLEEKIFYKTTNKKQELSVVAMFDYGSGRNEQSL